MADYEASTAALPNPEQLTQQIEAAQAALSLDSTDTLWRYRTPEPCHIELTADYPFVGLTLGLGSREALHTAMPVSVGLYFDAPSGGVYLYDPTPSRQFPQGRVEQLVPDEHGVITIGRGNLATQADAPTLAGRRAATVSRQHLRLQVTQLGSTGMSAELVDTSSNGTIVVKSR